MKKIFFLFILSSAVTFAQFSDETFYLSPSVFYTNGDYSTNVKSNSIAFYNTLQLFNEFFLINHYENLKIDGSDYDYLQQAFLAGGVLDLFPYYLKFNYAHYKGEYSYKPFEFSYNDYTNLYNLEFLYYVDWYYLGAAYSYLNQIGFPNTSSHQVTLRLEKILSNEFFISIKPNLTIPENDRTLVSVYSKLHYAPITNLIFKVGGFAGQRIFYFDSDLLTIFNQNYIQKYQIFAQVDYLPLDLIKLTAGYQHNKFTDFTVDYLYAGIKANFYISK